MELTTKKNKYSPAEVALLGVFAFGLLLSLFLVSNRKKIPFSPPIEAQFDGLSISMPSGRGWEGYDKWRFSSGENAFVLQSLLKKSTTPIAQVTWKYYIAPEKKSSEEIINRISAAGDFSKVRSGNAKFGELDFTTLVFTSRIKGTSEEIEDYYYATCELGFGRELKLEVRTAGDAELASRAFDSAIEKIKYVQDPRLDLGKAFIQKLKAAGVNAMLKRETAGTLKRVYLAENNNRKQTGRINIGIADYTGFTVELFSPVKGLSGSPRMSASTMYFVDGAGGWTARSLFDCDRSFDNFFWTTKQSSLESGISSSVVLEYENNVLRYHGKNFTLSPVLLPDIFIDSAAAAFHDSGDENVLVDLMLPDGRVVPTEISKIAPLTNLLTSNSDNTVRFTLYNANNSYYEIFFDNDGNITAKNEKTTRSFKLKKSNIKEVTDYFGQQKNEITEMLKKS